MLLYAIDETAAATGRPAGSRSSARARALRGVRVGATCGDEPSSQAADLVMQPTWDFDPARALLAERTLGKWVWAYNGRRPWGGPLMLDVPAPDLRANAWIAMRYGVARWFYWESTFWFDDDRGGRGGPRGFDPFVVAETFHNADGDHANGDGLLVYPGTQPGGGMVDYGVPRLSSLRCGSRTCAAGSRTPGIALRARGIDPRADGFAVVRRVIPAGARAGSARRASEGARPTASARRELDAILRRRSLPWMSPMESRVRPWVGGLLDHHVFVAMVAEQRDGLEARAIHDMCGIADRTRALNPPFLLKRAASEEWL